MWGFSFVRIYCLKHFSCVFAILPKLPSQTVPLEHLQKTTLDKIKCSTKPQRLKKRLRAKVGPENSSIKTKAMF